MLLQKGRFAGSLRHTQQGGGHGENEAAAPTDLHSGSKQQLGLSSPDPIHQDVLSGASCLEPSGIATGNNRRGVAKCSAASKHTEVKLLPATPETLLFHSLAVAAETFKLPQA